jgi:hypothetical protein
MTWVMRVSDSGALYCAATDGGTWHVWVMLYTRRHNSQLADGPTGTGALQFSNNAKNSHEDDGDYVSGNLVRLRTACTACTPGIHPRLLSAKQA